jgi:putative glutamine amidotransferase
VTKPVVGITLGDGERPGVHTMRADYVRSVEQAGAVPVLLATLPAQDAPLVLDRLDGVLLSGGPDVDPELYDRAPHPKLGRVNRRRDDFELALVREAVRRDLPLLAICRGQQVLNVAMGGTLLQDIPSELRGAVDHDPAGERWRRSHGVEVLAQTRLQAILGRESASVNSFHHQAVDRVGAGLVVSARCPDDGLVEGLEAPGSRFVLSVQWHPESFWNQPDSFRCLFDAHAEACRS